MDPLYPSRRTRVSGPRRWDGVETHKNYMLESVSGKKVIFFSPHLAIPTYHSRYLHIYCLPISGSSFCLVHLPSACMLPMNSVATTTMSKNLTAPSISTSHQPCAHVASLAVVVQCCMLGGGTSSALGGARRFRSACTEHESMHAEGT